MSFFQQLGTSNLFVAPAGATDRGWIGFLIPATVSPPAGGVELADALTSVSLGGSLLFSAAAPDVSTSAAIAAFIAQVTAVIANAPLPRNFIWLTNPANVTPQTAPLFGIDSGGTVIRSGMQAPIVPQLTLNVSGGMTLTLQGDVLTLNGNGQITFTGGYAPNVLQISSATLAFTGPYRGTLRFGANIQRQSLNDELCWGFQFLVPRTDGVRPATAEWLPLAAGYINGGDYLGFAMTFDPADVLNAQLPDRTTLVFTGLNLDNTETTLASYYRTVFGAPVTLVPVPGPIDTVPNAGRFVFNAGAVTDAGDLQLQLAPEGDFILALDAAAASTPYDLLCGLQGTEYIAFLPRIGGGYAGDRLRFVSRKPAYATHYPLPPSSPVLPPFDPQSTLLGDTYLTSWATVVSAAPGNGQPYVAQPNGASLHGRDDTIHTPYPSLFGAQNPSVLIKDDGRTFPMAPLAGAQPGVWPAGLAADQMEDLERQFIAPTRRAAIAAGVPKYAASKHHALGLRAAAATPFNTTTPSGLLVTVGEDGSWNKLLLGQNLSPAQRQMYFCGLDDALQQAFQTNGLFLVVANADHLGALSGSGDGTCTSAASFFNRMNIGDWEMRADVGNNRYNDYTNIIIVKGRAGALYDPTSIDTQQASLVSNPDKWTQNAAFGAPSNRTANPSPPPATVTTPGNPADLPALSFWLQKYFLDASKQTDTEYFHKFNTIAKEATWTGILILRMSIAGLPAELAGMAAGITDPGRFNAHHLGVEISPVANDPTAPLIDLSNSSSMFGLIYYVDPEVTSTTGDDALPPVPPAPGAVYDFRVLTLKVLFESTAVRHFQSYAQVTLNTLFGSQVTAMGTGGNPYNTIVLHGTYQVIGGQGVYGLSATGDNTFYLDSNVLRRVEITGAQLSTRNAGTQAVNPTVISWVGLTGFLDFLQMSSQSGGFDVLSFGNVGNTQATDVARQGLSFSNLGVEMLFPLSDPSQCVYSFAADEMRFDVATSTPRPNSLFLDFALEIDSFIIGTADSAPSANGYLNVVTDVRLSGVDGGSWFAMRYKLNMGGAGALASNAGLTSYLITGWSPVSTGDDYQALVGISLPGTGGGAKLISLQTVISLSIGQLVLTYAPTTNPAQSSFLLMLTDIAIKFFGILKIPPNGTTMFYLFGNPQSGGSASGLGWYAAYNNEPKAFQSIPPTAPPTKLLEGAGR